jgi:hypothetical protein
MTTKTLTIAAAKITRPAAIKNANDDLVKKWQFSLYIHGENAYKVFRLEKATLESNAACELALKDSLEFAKENGIFAKGNPHKFYQVDDLSIKEAAALGVPVIGDMTYRNANCPHEANDQQTFFNNLPPHIKAVAFHAKNEGRKTYGQAAHDKAQGQVTGTPDIIIPGLNILIELKRQDSQKSRVGIEQVEYLLAAQKLGAKVYIALGWENAMKTLDDD